MQLYCSYDSGCDFYRRGICYNDNGACGYQRTSPGKPSAAEILEMRPTNADRIRRMTDEELARNNVRKRRGYVIWSTSDGREFSSYLFGGTYRPDEETIALAIQHELDWLQQPAETEGTE